MYRCERVLSNYTFEKGLVLRIYRNSKISIAKRKQKTKIPKSDLKMDSRLKYIFLKKIPYK
jgi:hypothetical protein